MNTRTACFAGLAAVAMVLAGCAAQYRNSSACEQEMRRRLADASQGELSVAHRAVARGGSRVVVEGNLEKVPGAASAVPAASAAVVASAASAPAAAAPKPTTPVAALVQRFGSKKPALTPTAAECTFDESALKSFRWLAPAVLAKTTPDPAAPAD
jgi:hypothetical protein